MCNTGKIVTATVHVDPVHRSIVHLIQQQKENKSKGEAHQDSLQSMHKERWKKTLMKYTN